MIHANSDSPGLTWLAFAFLTVISWGVYGVFLHTGQVAMQDPANGRYKAFLFVGIAYFSEGRLRLVSIRDRTVVRLPAGVLSTAIRPTCGFGCPGPADRGLDAAPQRCEPSLRPAARQSV